MPEKRLDELEQQLLDYTKNTNECVFHYDQQVRIEHEDGSRMTLRNAILVCEGDFVYILTEHCGRHWFHRDDLASVQAQTLGPPRKNPIDFK